MQNQEVNTTSLILEKNDSLFTLYNTLHDHNAHIPKRKAKKEYFVTGNIDDITLSWVDQYIKREDFA